MQGRFQPRNDDERERLRDAGIADMARIYGPVDLVGDNVMFAATGVTRATCCRACASSAAARRPTPW